MMCVLQKQIFHISFENNRLNESILQANSALCVCIWCSASLQLWLMLFPLQINQINEIRHLLTTLFLFTFSYHSKDLFYGWWLSITAKHFCKTRCAREKPLLHRDMQNDTVAAALADMVPSAVTQTWFSWVFLLHFLFYLLLVLHVSLVIWGYLPIFH